MSGQLMNEATVDRYIYIINVIFIPTALTIPNMTLGHHSCKMSVYESWKMKYEAAQHVHCSVLPGSMPFF